MLPGKSWRRTTWYARHRALRWKCGKLHEELLIVVRLLPKGGFAFMRMGNSAAANQYMARVLQQLYSQQD